MQANAASGNSIIKIQNYTLGEELMNAITHGVGAGLGVAALVLCIVRASIHHNPYAIISGIIYGITLIVLYLISTLYHSFSPNIKAKKVFRVFDHCSIFLLIYGSYLPFLFVTLNGIVGWTLFAVMTAVTAIGITLNAINLEKYKKISMACYIFMGWIIVFAFKSLLDSLDMNAIILLLIGGIVYTVGAIIYGIGKKVRYMHSLWHVFVLAASILQFFSIYLYVL